MFRDILRFMDQHGLLAASLSMLTLASVVLLFRRNEVGLISVILSIVLVGFAALFMNAYASTRHKR